MIILVANTKGGTGKSTIVTNIATEIYRSGIETRVIDIDDGNHTTKNFFDNRKDIDCFTPETYKDIAQVCKQFNGDIVVDSMGMDSNLLRAIITIADVVIIPYKRGKIEENSLIKFIGILNEVGEVVNKKKCILVPSQFYHSTTTQTINKEVEALKQYGFIISEPIYQSVKYSDALGENKSVYELGGANKQALEIMKLLELVKG